VEATGTPLKPGMKLAAGKPAVATWRSQISVGGKEEAVATDDTVGGCGGGDEEEEVRGRDGSGDREEGGTSRRWGR